VAPIHAGDSQIRVILLDIEGTTTPVDFVYKKLFPYASRYAESYLREHSRDSEIQSLEADLRAQHEHDVHAGLAPPPWTQQNEHDRIQSSIDYVHWLMARDSKCSPLKTLQGQIWRQGYERGELHGEVYPDVPVAFARWRRQGREICIYSSGSVLAQQLLFRSTQAGDLTQYISNFFDTRIGAKNESASYTNIVKTLGCRASEVLFISDTIKEILAARDAFLQAVLCMRQAEAPASVSVEDFIRTFDQVLPT